MQALGLCQLDGGEAKEENKREDHCPFRVGVISFDESDERLRLSVGGHAEFDG